MICFLLDHRDWTSSPVVWIVVCWVDIRFCLNLHDLCRPVGCCGVSQTFLECIFFPFCNCWILFSKFWHSLRTMLYQGFGFGSCCQLRCPTDQISTWMKSWPCMLMVFDVGLMLGLVFLLLNSLPVLWQFWGLLNLVLDLPLVIMLNNWSSYDQEPPASSLSRPWPSDLLKSWFSSPRRGISLHFVDYGLSSILSSHTPLLGVVS